MKGHVIMTHEYVGAKIYDHGYNCYLHFLILPKTHTLISVFKTAWKTTDPYFCYRLHSTWPIYVPVCCNF